MIEYVLTIYLLNARPSELRYPTRFACVVTRDNPSMWWNTNPRIAIVSQCERRVASA